MPMRVSEEKRANIRSLFSDGMPAKAIARALKMDQRTVQRIVADLPDPHAGTAQAVYARAGQMRKYGPATGFNIADPLSDDELG